MSSTRLGRVQHLMMKVLWEKGRASARDITEALSREETIAHSTVQTLLRQLEEKGAVAHEVVDRTFIYYPVLEEDRVVHSATRELIERVFGGSPAGLVAYLLKGEKISAKELTKIRQLIDEKQVDGNQAGQQQPKKPSKRGRKS